MSRRHPMLYELLLVQEKRRLKELVVKALPVLAAPSKNKQHLIDMIMEALRLDCMIDDIYSKILSCFSVDYLKLWIRSHAKDGARGARGAKTKLDLIAVFLVLDRPADGADTAAAPMPPEPPLMQLVPLDDHIQTVKTLRKSWVKGAKFLCRKRKSKLMLTVIRDAILAMPEITISALQRQVDRKVSLTINGVRGAAYLFFHKMVMKELSGIRFIKKRDDDNKMQWRAARYKAKRRRRPADKHVIHVTGYIQCAGQWREMARMFQADHESKQCARMWS